MTRDDTERDYAKRIMRVVSHIADNLDAPLDLDRLAEIACFSRWHFHRIYRGVLGETADQTVRRLRLQRAALALVETQDPIVEIARRAGYGSVEAFSRAFSASYGRPPTAYRARRSRPSLDDPRRAFAKENTPMPPVEIDIAPERTLLGLDHQGPYPEIGSAFERLFAWAGPQGLVTADTLMIAIYYCDPDATPASELRSFAGMTTDAAPRAEQLAEGMRIETVPGGPVARLRHKGPYAELPSAYRRLYADWLPSSGREPAETPPYEIYRNSPQSTPPPELLTDIYVPLKP